MVDTELPPNVPSMVAHLRERVAKLESSNLPMELEKARADAQDLKEQVRELERQRDYLDSVIDRMEREIAELRGDKE